ASLSADFAVETTGTSPNQEILFAADNVSTFVGDTKGTATSADDIGVRFSGGSLLGYIAPDSTYAFDASGSASLVGVSDLTLTGTLSAQKNTTGANVNKSISVAGISRTLNVAAGVSRVGGSVTLITPVANLSADFAVETTGTSPNQEILFAAENVSTFVGDTKGTASTADDIGVRFSGGSLVGYIAPDSTYAFNASGSASLVGVSDLTLTGTLSAQKNTTGDNVNKSITVAGTSRTLNVAAGASRVGGSVTLITPVANLSADFAVETTGASPNQEILFAADNVSTFVGDTKGTAATGDDIGVRFSGGSLVGYIAPDSTYAFDASGTASLVGVSDLTLTGTLSAQKNTTGANVNKSITVAGIPRTLNVAAGASRVGGSITLITPVASLSADFAVETTGTSPNQEILFAADNVSTFVGDTKGTAATGDDIGVRFSGGSLVGYIAPDSTYAFDASGTAELLGISGLTLEGTLLARKNTTGAAISRSISVAGFARHLSVPAGASSVSGTLTIGTGIADFSGDFLIESRGTSPDRTLIFGASGMEAFIGSSDGPGAADDVGLQVTNTALIVLVTSEGDYAVDASGSVNVVGVTNLRISGDLRFERNTTGQTIQQSVTIGTVTRTISQATDLSRRSGSLNVSAGGFVDFSGDFSIADTADGNGLLFGAANIDVFLGRGAETTDTADDLGLSITDANLGLLLYTKTASKGKYALSAAGDAALVGLPGLSMTATSMVASQNTTGRSVSETVNVNGTPVVLDFPDAADVQEFRGEVRISAADVFEIAGEISATRTLSGNVVLNVPTLSLKVNQGVDEVFSVHGSARFLISPEDGFRVVDLGLETLDFYTLSLPISTGEMPDLSSPVEGNGSGSFGGSWGAGVDSTKAGVATTSILGGGTEASILNRQGYIDITYYSPGSRPIDSATILDAAPEFTISGTAVGDAVYDRVEKLSETRYRYYFKDSNKSNTTPAFNSGNLQLQFVSGGWLTTDGLAAPAASLSATVRSGAGTGGGTSIAKRGPLTISGPEISIEDLQFKLKPAAGGGLPDTASVVVTIGISAASGALNFGTQEQRTKSGVSLDLTDILATFDVGVDLNIPAILGMSDGPKIKDGGLTGKFNLDVGSMKLTVPQLVTVEATGIKVSMDPQIDKNGDGTESQAEKDDFSKRQILSVETASVTIPKLSISGAIQNLIVRNDGFQLGDASITRTGTTTLGSLLQMNNVTVGITDFGATFGGSVVFDGELYFATSDASIFPGKAYSATIEDNADPGLEAFRATPKFEAGEFKGFEFTADKFRIKFNKFLTVTAEKINVNTDASDTEEVVSFTSVTAALKVASLNVGGEMRNFAILGDGKFVTKEGFGVFMSLDSADPAAFKWPSWLPIKLTKFGILWDDIEAKPEIFKLSLSASVSKLFNLPLDVTGAVSDLILDPTLLADGKFPITDIGGLAISISGDLFGGRVTGGLMGGILKIDSAGNRIPAGSSTPVADRILFIGLEGGFELSGIGGLTIKLAFSELGPLSVMITGTSPEGVVLNGATGLTIKGFTAGVEFFKTLPAISEPEELRGSAFNINKVVDAGTWLTSTEDQVVKQYKEIKQNPNRAGFLAAFTSPMLITGQGDLFFKVAEKANKGQVIFKLDTQGRFMAGGKRIFFDGLLTASGKVYADLSQVAQGNAKIMMLIDAPEEFRMLTIKGKIETKFLRADGSEVQNDTGDVEVDSTKPVGASIFPAAGGEVGIEQWKANPWIDITFAAPANKTLDIATILDVAAEIDLIAPDGSRVTVSATPTQPEGFNQVNKFRYALPTGFTPEPGEYQVKFLAETFADKTPTTNLLRTDKFIVTTPKAVFAAPAGDGSIDRVALNADKTLTVYFNPVGGGTIDSATILDADPEFTLTGDAAEGIVLGVPTKSGDNDYEYRYPFTGDFGRGQVEFAFIAGSFADEKQNLNLAGTGSFTVIGAVGALAGPSQDVKDLNARGYLNFEFSPTLNATIDEASIADTDPEFTLIGSAASAVTINGDPVKQEDGTWRYFFTGQFTTGSVQVLFNEGSFTDSAGNQNLGSSVQLRVEGATAIPLFPANATPASLELLNDRKWFEIQFKAASGNTIDDATVLDAGNEFSLSGKGVGTAVVTSIEKVGTDIFRYHFTGEFKSGAVTVTFPAGAFGDSGNLKNITTIRTWQLDQLTGALASPRENEAVSATVLATKSSIDVKLPGRFSSNVLASSVTDGDAEIQLVTKDSSGAYVPIPGVAIDGIAEAVSGSDDTWRFRYSGTLPDSALIYVKFVEASWIDEAGNPSAESVTSFRTFRSADTFELTVNGSLELRLPFVGDDDTVIFGVYGYATLRAQTGRAVLDFGGHAEMIYLGSIAATAGRIVFNTTADGTAEFWGVATLQTNFEKLQPLGVKADLEATLQFNTSKDAKNETITLKGQGAGGDDLTRTYQLQREMFRIEAGGILALHVPTFEVGPPTGMQLARASGAFSIEVSSLGLKAFLKADLEIGPADARLLDFDALGVLSITDAGLALDIQLKNSQGLPGPLAEFFSFTVGGRLTLNTTGESQEVPISPNLLEYIPDDFKAQLPPSTGNPDGKSLIVPAGPPQRDGSEGAAGAYLVAELEGNLKLASVFELDGYLRFEVSTSQVRLDIDALLSVGPIGGVAANGTLIIDSSGVVGSLQIVAMMEIGPASLEAAAQLEINTRSTAASVTRYKYDFTQNKVSTEKETASIAPRTFRIFAAGNAEISNVVRISGMFEFNAQMTPSGPSLLAYVNASAYVGPFDVDLLKLDITGLLYWHGTEFAMRVDATVAMAVPGISLDVNLDLAMNTSGQDITYVVPDSMRALTDRTSFTVPAGPPKLGGGYGPAGTYVVAMGAGTLDLLNLVQINGEFRFEISSTKVDLFVGATIDLGPFGDAGISGNMQFGAEGAAGAFSIAIESGLDGAGLKLQGQFQFEFNTGSAPATVRTIDVDKATGEVKGFKDVELPGQSVHLVLGGQVLIANVFEVKGRVELAWVDGGFDMDFFGVLDLAGFNALTVEGGAQIRDGHFACYTDIGAGNISIPMVTIQGNFELEVNTSEAPVTIGDRTIAPATCQILIGATIRILGFELSGDVILGVEDGVFGIELKDLKLNFFNFIDVNINGYVKSNGDFLFEGSIDIDIPMGPFKLYGGVGVKITNDSFKGWIYGGVDFAMDFGLFEIQFTLASLRANFEITQTSAAAELEVTVLGFTAGGSIAWSWGPPPKIARKDGSTLLLNVGPDGYLRGEDYTDITNESYNIKPGKNPGEVIVSSMGVDETYTGITSVSVPDFGGGKDFLYVDPEVEMDMVVHGGADADTLYLTGQGNVKAFGEAGNDKIYGGAGDDEIDGGAGDNLLYGMEGSDILIGLGGDDYIEGGAGNDRILAGAGDNEIYGGEPDETFDEDDNDQIIAGNGNSVIYGGSGDDEITVGSGSSVIYGGAGDDTITATSETGTTKIFGDDGNDTIDVGIGNDQIDAGGGDDVINSIGGNDQINAGDGDDTVTIILQTDGARLQVYGGGGTDSLDLTGPSNGQPLVMGEHTFTGSVLSLEFDNDIDVIRFTDTSASTILNTATLSSMNYGSIDFSVTGNS
ncbi:MAG: hypothetical protein RLZZ232_779, partial [Planctomycetota bacterium]